MTALFPYKWFKNGWERLFCLVCKYDAPGRSASLLDAPGRLARLLGEMPSKLPLLVDCPSCPEEENHQRQERYLHEVQTDRQALQGVLLDVGIPVVLASLIRSYLLGPEHLVALLAKLKGQKWKKSVATKS